MLTVYKEKISFKQQKMSPCKDCKSTHIIALLRLDYFSNCNDHAQGYGPLQGWLIRSYYFDPNPTAKPSVAAAPVPVTCKLNPVCEKEEF